MVVEKNKKEQFKNPSNFQIFFEKSVWASFKPFGKDLDSKDLWNQIQ